MSWDEALFICYHVIVVQHKTSSLFFLLLCLDIVGNHSFIDDNYISTFAQEQELASFKSDCQFGSHSASLIDASSYALSSHYSLLNVNLSEYTS